MNENMRPFRASLDEHMQLAAQAYRAGKAGPFPEFYCRRDTGGPRPGLLIAAGPTNYTPESLARLAWTCREYTDRRGMREISGRYADSLSWADLLDTIRRFGYDPTARYWVAG